ncbi:MAG: undecaprenyl-diphosphate phosphatase [Eubacterium sp.]|nr:undecaprenyl-diphosphate phosphatase [Eubacterium sp.]
MSILSSIIQSILQAIFEILPISASAHSAAFHEFAGRADGTCSAITGIVHMGIAVGIIAATFNVFARLFKEFIATFSDMLSKSLKGSSKKPARRFMYQTMISFVPLLLWLIPFGKSGFLFTVLHKTSYNGTLLDEGIFMLLTGALVLAAARQLGLSRNDKSISFGLAVLVGFLILLMLPMSGFSLLCGIFSVLVLCGVARRPALRYALVITAPVMLVYGIVETCIGESAGVVAGILAAVISVVVSFLAVKVLRFIIKNNYF